MKNDTRSKLLDYSDHTGLAFLALLLALLPFHGITTVKEILFFIVLGTFILGRILLNRDSLLKPHPRMKGLGFFLVLSLLWAAITAFYAVDPSYSMNEVIRKMTKHYLLYLLAFFFVYNVPPERNILPRFFFPLLLSALLMSAYASYQFSLDPRFFYNRVTGFTGRFYRLATFLVISLPLIAVLPFIVRWRHRYLLLLSVPLSIIAIFFTSVRAAWLAVLFQGILLVSILLRKHRRWIILGSVLIVTLLSLAAYKSQSYKNLIIHGPRSEGARVVAAVRSLKIIREHPVTGIGYGKKVFSKYYPDLEEPIHPHNIFLSTAVELGIPGLVFFTAIVGIIIRSFFRELKKEMPREDRLLFAAIVSSITGFLILNLFDYMYHGWPGMMFWIITGTGHALIKRNSESSTRGLT